MSKTIGYVIAFLPMIVGGLVAFLLTSNILPASLADEAISFGTLLSSGLLIYATFRQITGKCVCTAQKNQLNGYHENRMY